MVRKAKRQHRVIIKPSKEQYHILLGLAQGDMDQVPNVILHMIDTIIDMAFGEMDHHYIT